MTVCCTLYAACCTCASWIPIAALLAAAESPEPCAEAALAAAVAARHLELIEAWSVLANVRERSDELRDLLHDRVASKPAVREVRLEGLMGGVELAPPADGLRWGRRVCAAAVARGVLLRPLGDVVVLMPPLTTTADEIERIVSVLAESITEATAHDLA